MPTTAAIYAYMLYVVENAEAFNRGDIDDFSQVGVQAIDQNTLRVSLKNSTPYFLSLLSHYSTWPVHKQTIEKFGRIDSRGTAWTRPGNFVGNGPYTLTEWKLNDVIIVKKNLNYWNADTVSIKEIRFFASDNETSEDYRYRSGQLHLLNSIKVTKIQSYKEKYSDDRFKEEDFSVTNTLCKTVLSLPMHTELTTHQMDYISNTILEFIHE